MPTALDIRPEIKKQAGICCTMPRDVRPKVHTTWPTDALRNFVIHLNGPPLGTACHKATGRSAMAP